MICDAHYWSYFFLQLKIISIIWFFFVKYDCLKNSVHNVVVKSIDSEGKLLELESKFFYLAIW